MSTRIRLALDRTPNTNHTGFYIALARGWYEKEGVDLQIITPDQENYQTMPARRVSQRDAELAITPSESVISYQTNGVPLIAVATVLARDVSAIVTLRGSGISRPRDMDGKVYASYGARYEEDIIRQLIQNDDGRGQFIAHKLPWASIWRGLLTREVDAAWCWLTWEGVKAEIEGVELNQFLFDEYEIPYGYNPVLTAHRDWCEENADLLRRFLAVTSAGFHEAVRNSDEAARLLIKTSKHPQLTDRNFVEHSQQMVSGYFLDADRNWGFMHRNIWASFANWMIRNRMLSTPDGELIQRIDADTLFTNKFLESTSTIAW